MHWRRLVGRRPTLDAKASYLRPIRKNAKALSTMMGHASVTITYDRYGHLMPGAEQESADLLDAYIARKREEAAAK